MLVNYLVEDSHIMADGSQLRHGYDQYVMCFSWSYIICYSEASAAWVVVSILYLIDVSQSESWICQYIFLMFFISYYLFSMQSLSSVCLPLVNMPVWAASVAEQVRNEQSWWSALWDLLLYNSEQATSPRDTVYICNRKRLREALWGFYF